jgi:ectoine hydroxylase-related dioxygenase (phytanoyl-CoA dioxygenase family)
VFFTSALFHGAATNPHHDVKRTAKLMQVSSVSGRTMGTGNRIVVCRALYTTLLARKRAGAAEAELRTIIAAAAGGVPVPTNLDLTRRPVGCSTVSA